jgi:negative regulator of replication initiation
MRHPRLYVIVSGCVVALLALTTAFAAPTTPPQQENPTLTAAVLEALQEATDEAIEAELQATSDQLALQASATQAVVATSEALEATDTDDFEATTEALQGNVGATATAVTENVLGTATPTLSPTPTIPATPTFAPTLNPTEMRGTQVIVTAAAAGTAQALPQETAQATVEAATAALPEGLQTLDAAQLAALLGYAADNGGLQVNAGAGAVVITYHLTEATLAAYIDAALFIGGYPPTGLQVDTTATGLSTTAQTITVGDISGPLTTNATVAILEGQVALAVDEITVGGEALPPEVAAPLAAQMNAALTSALTNNLIFDYLVDDAFATETGLVVTLVIPFAFPAG